MGLWAKIRAAGNVLILIVRFPIIYVKWLYKHWRAKNTFKRHLLSEGFPANEAHELTKLYPFKIGDMMQLAKMSRKKPNIKSA